MDEIAARVRADIERYGWHVAKIPGEDPVPAWAFTIGLRERFQHPELAVFGIDLELLHPLLNRLGSEVRRGRQFTEGDRVDGVLEALPCAFRHVESCWIDVFLGNAAWHYESREFGALQCFWPDRAGRFPWEEGFDPAWREQQPLLYESAPDRALGPVLREALRREGALSPDR
ncbi:MAG: DUF4262 domain-containing protein [Proteobacteria bacterium]|nr:DUF4262 domain-containing protein [Pseudomonadota bacterium]